MTITLDSKIGEIVRFNFSTARIFEAVQLDQLLISNSK
jgi:hypothetical protein